MSLLKANSVQIGQSTTGTNNFTLSVPSSPDGTIKLARGNSGATTADVLTVNASGAITGATITSSTVNGGTITSATAQATTSGTAIDFTGIPSWVKRITVMFSGVSVSGASSFLVQIGSGSITSSGYNSCAAGSINAASPAVAASTAGYLIIADTDSDVKNGHMVITLMGSNLYVSSHTLGGDSTRDVVWWGGGSVTLGGTLDRVRITTVNGTDTFDAGSINIMYEG
jgi:hypothetical protein